MSEETQEPQEERRAAEAEVIRDVTLASARPKKLDPEDQEVSVVVAPPGCEARVVDTERFREAPRRRSGQYVVHETDALIAYLRDQGDHGTVWLDGVAQPPVVTAVLNDHLAEGPGWRDHRATLALQHTPEWVRWLLLDNELLDQVTFAQHIEDSLLDIVNPDGADMLELAESFHAHSSVQFRSAQRLSDGRVQMAYHEEVEATAGRDGRLEIPQTFDLRIAVFLGEEPVDITARLRYRIGGGRLAIGYKLDRPEVVLNDALGAIGDRLNSEFGSRVYAGAAPDYEGGSPEYDEE